MLGRLRMTIEETITAYKALAPDIFQKKWWTQSQPLKYFGAEMQQYWFEGKNLSNAVRRLLQDKKLDPDLKLREADDPECRVFVCTVSAFSTETELLRSYKSRQVGHPNYDCCVWEAVRATSAAPLFFEPVTLMTSHATFVDGGVRANNPIYQVSGEARRLWPGRNVGCLLSLGTGITSTKGFDPRKSRLHQVLQSLADIATDANARSREFRDTQEGRELIKSRKYFRFSVSQGMDDVDLSQFEKFPYMESMTVPYSRDQDDGIEECAKNLANPTSTSNSVYQIPFELQGVPIVNKFVARNMELKKMEEALLPGPTSHVRRKVFVLYGLGGVGKTQLAVEFARMHKKSFNAVFWLDGSTRGRVEQSLAAIVRRLPQEQISETSQRFSRGSGADLEAAIKDVLTWLNLPTNDKWLLVFDNVDRDDSAELEDPDAFNPETYFPSADQGSILITTRLSRLEQLGSSWRLSGMSEDQGRDLLELRAGTPLSDSKEVVRELGGLPLALAQAGSFMRQTNTNGSEYLSMYNDMWGALFKTSTTGFLRDYPNRSVATTWTLSFQQIKKVRQDAAQLLLLWACLAYSDLWYELFVPFVHSQSMWQDQIPTWLTRSVGDQLSFKQTIKFLLDYSMVEAQIESSALYLHPVVHAWCFHEELKDKEEMIQLAALVVGSAIPTKKEPGYSILQRRLLPHCDRIYSLTQRVSSFDVSHKEVTDYLMASYHNLGALYSDQGKLKEAEEMYQRALKGDEKAWGPEHTSTLDTVNNLGNLYNDQGKLKEAEEMYQRALKGKEKAWGSEHTSTLDTVNNLGTLYGNQGKLKEAEEMFRRALKGKEKAWGSEHMSTLDTVSNLGNLYRIQGKLKEAEEMYQRALKGREKAWGPEHTSTLNTVNNLGILYSDQGKLKEAEEMYQRALKGYEKAWGPEHTSTLNTVNNLGTLYGNQGKLKEAEEMYQRALKGKEKAWGSEHTSTLDTVNNLGNLYRNQGKLKEAEEMYQRALNGYEKAWGPEHTSTLDTVNNLGTLYGDQGKLKEAEEMYQRALKGYEEAWGPEHTSTLDTVNNLGVLYRDQGKLKEAEEMYQRALKGYEKLRGRDHPTQWS